MRRKRGNPRAAEDREGDKEGGRGKRRIKGRGGRGVQRLARSDFFFILLVHGFANDRPISLVFFSIVQKNSFVLNVIVHFPSISFVFSVNNRSVKN